LRSVRYESPLVRQPTLTLPVPKRLISLATSWTRGRVTRAAPPIQEALARAYARQSMVGLGISMVCQIVIAMTAYGLVDPVFLWSWFWLGLGVSAYFLWRGYKKRDKKIVGKSAQRLISRAWAGATLLGLCWGVTALFLSWLDKDRDVVVIIVACGLCAGAASILAAIPNAARIFMVSLCLPYVAFFLWETSLPDLMLAITALILLQAMLLATRANYTMLVEGVEAQLAAQSALSSLSQAEQHWRELSETAEAFALFDANHDLVLWNEGYGRLLGIPSEILQRGQPWSKIWQLAHYQRLPEAAALVVNKSYEQKNWTEEHELRTQWLRSTIRQLANGHVVVSHVDITKLKQRENELLKLKVDLEDARDLAEQASQAKSRFLANMSHELRTPLNAVIGFSDLMLHQLSSGGSHLAHAQYAKTIHHSGQHLLSIVEDMLDLARIEAGKVMLDESVVDLVELIDSAIPIALGQQVTRPPQIIRDLPSTPCPVFIDARLTRQSFINLLGNAIKFSKPEGHVWVSLAVLYSDELEICVQDEGIGIPEHLVEEVIKPFAQVETPEAKRFGGVGLGLPLAKQFIELMGGRLILSSQTGKGTKAQLILPKARRLDEAALEEELRAISSQMASFDG
jgi:PAS domain S-box-containing protein